MTSLGEDNQELKSKLIFEQDNDNQNAQSMIGEFLDSDLNQQNPVRLHYENLQYLH